MLQPTTLAENLYFTTVPIWVDREEESWTGTGFLLGVDIEGGSMSLLVTNKHVLGAPDETSIGVHVSDEHGNWKAATGFRIPLASLPSEMFAGHPDPDVDVAVANISPILSGTFEDSPAFYRTFTFDHLFTDAAIAELDALEDVIFVGYPAGIADRVHNTPIVRRGIAATPLSLDYSGESAFLIDAAVHPGSSGSPVLLWNSGSYRSRDGSLVVGSRFGLLGVLAAVHTNFLDTEYVSIPAEQRPVVRQPVGLGIVYRSRTIAETVDTLCSQLGVPRVDRNQVEEGDADPTPAH